MPEILPHPKRGTMEIGTERIMPVFGNIRAAEGASDENPVVTIIGTDGSEDRHGSVINPRGWLTASYLRNPKVLWSHGTDEGKPALGETVALRSVGGAWEFDIKFALGPWRNIQDNLAQFWWEWYRDFGGTLASSVAFLPKKWIDRQAKEMPTFFAENVEYTEQELTEISFVNVPSNRNAVTEAVARARSAGKFSDGLASMLGFAVSPIIIRSQPEERMSVPKEKAAPVESRAAATECDCCADDASPCDCATKDETTDGTCSCHSDCADCSDLGCDGLAAAVEASAPSSKKRGSGGIVDPYWVGDTVSISPEVLRKKSNGEPLNAEEQSALSMWTRALNDSDGVTERQPPTSSFRAALKESISAIRCGDYRDDYGYVEYCPLCYAKLGTCNDAEDVSPEDATSEQATITAMLTAKTQQLHAALAGWSTAEHDALRQFCSDNVYNAMWNVEKLWVMAETWYDDMIPAAETPEGMPRMLRKFTEATLKDPAALKRAGAVLSAASKKKLQKAIDLHAEMGGHLSSLMDSANKSDAEDTTTKSVDHPQEFRITGVPSLGSDEDDTPSIIVVSARDDSGAGTGDRSKKADPPSLYTAKVLPVRNAR